jgi:pSer/pThr/pTyr-binding forkhead associated (FHA) protein
MNPQDLRPRTASNEDTSMVEVLSSLDQTIIPGLEDDNSSDSRSFTELLMSQSPQPRRKGYGIKLYLPAVRDPIELRNLPLTTIGRRDHRQQIYPALDLTEHHAAQLGVSRLHAQIVFKEGRFYMLDLASKNGSWVNGERLNPHQPKNIGYQDTLRLGHFIIHVGACQYS